MPIVIDRHTGQMISKLELSQEQKDAAWGQIIRNWVRLKPEELERHDEGTSMDND